MQGRHIIGFPGTGMPAEQVVVVLAKLARPVVMADVVEVGLRQRRVHETEDQEDDPQYAHLASSKPTLDGHW